MHSQVWSDLPKMGIDTAQILTRPFGSSLIKAILQRRLAPAKIGPLHDRLEAYSALLDHSKANLQDPQHSMRDRLPAHEAIKPLADMHAAFDEKMVRLEEDAEFCKALAEALEATDRNFWVIPSREPPAIAPASQAVTTTTPATTTATVTTPATSTGVSQITKEVTDSLLRRFNDWAFDVGIAGRGVSLKVPRGVGRANFIASVREVEAELIELIRLAREGE